MYVKIIVWQCSYCDIGVFCLSITGTDIHTDNDILKHPCLLTLGTEINLKHMCGFITRLKIYMPCINKPTRSKKAPVMYNNLSNEAKAQGAEIDEFLLDLKELRIGGMESEP